MNESKSFESELKDCIKVQLDNLSDEYMRGIANGLIYALSIYSGNKPEYIEFGSRKMKNICKDCINHGALFYRDKQLSKAYEKIEEMKCCGNCKVYEPWNDGTDRCLVIVGKRTPVVGNHVCDKWKIK